MSWSESKWIVRNCKKIINEAKNKTVTATVPFYGGSGERPVYPGDANYDVLAKIEGVDVSKYNYCYLDGLNYNGSDGRGVGLFDLNTEKFVMVTYAHRSGDTGDLDILKNQDGFDYGTGGYNPSINCYGRVYKNTLYLVLGHHSKEYLNGISSVTATFM